MNDSQTFGLKAESRSTVTMDNMLNLRNRLFTKSATGCAKERIPAEQRF